MQADESTGALRYATFNQRAFALFLDGAILNLATALCFWPMVQSRTLMVTGAVVSTVFTAWYGIYCVARWGGTPGKLLLKLRIVRRDGAPASLREAVLRNAVQCAFSLVGLAEFIPEIDSLPPLEGLGFLEMGKLFQEVQQRNSLALGWSLSQWLGLSWSVAELLTLLFHPQRRAVHDLIAGTVVIDVGPEREASPTARLGQRVLARVLDSVLFVGLIGGICFSMRRVDSEVVLCICLAIAFAFWAYVPARWGGTPFKVLSGLRIEEAHGAPVSLAWAFVRGSPEVVLMLAFVLGTKPELPFARAWDIQAATILAAVLWFGANALTLLFSGRRSLADVLAGTLVKER